VNPETKILRSDINSWLPAAQYYRIGMRAIQPVCGVGPQTFATSPNVAGAAGAALNHRAHAMRGWFY